MVLGVDFWGEAVPAWVAAVGGVFSAVIAAWALISSIRTRGGVHAISSALNDEQRGAEHRVAEASASGNGTLSAVGTASPGAVPRDGGESDTGVVPEAWVSPVTWSVRKYGRQWLLRNDSSTTSAILLGAEDLGGHEDFHIASDLSLPLVIGPGVTLPVLVERTFASPSVTAVRISWKEREESRVVSSVVLYV